MQSITVSTRARCQLVNITGDIQRLVRESGMDSGQVVCFVPHTTAGLTIQENADPDVVHDLLWKLDQLAPRDEAAYHHGEGNSDAHVKCTLVGVSLTVLVEGGSLQLGTWQGIYFCEFDGPRQRRVMVKCIAD